ncbi:RelA/SpoT domain-containing protein [Tropicibacter oceani]|uniref:RelA/SpoT domain-containing protein n=1 Tax=Tropicibacter oceani TaxID=3058420 RepID=A0ABY8QM12_9RHOB|nr:RelA/SpoT domain-containing protein [Tropicibacter oceani]WGW05675.1 RelA/SpoT domain-containing protein [Tropicibacter oceani]
MEDAEWNDFEAAYLAGREDTEIFMDGVQKFFSRHSLLKTDGVSVVHSIKARMKGLENLRAKIERKNSEGRGITPENLFEEVTDLAGVRLLLLFQGDFATVDAAIRAKVEGEDWVFHERPKAFTWDPEASLFFKNFDLQVDQRDTSYTSVHYLLKPRADRPICCELQVRTLFEEIWGEIDHRINYPVPTDNVSCREQLKVLSKIVGAGSRLADSIQRSLEKD